MEERTTDSVEDRAERRQENEETEEGQEEGGRKACRDKGRPWLLEEVLGFTTVTGRQGQGASHGVVLVRYVLCALCSVLASGRIGRIGRIPLVAPWQIWWRTDVTLAGEERKGGGCGR